MSGDRSPSGVKIPATFCLWPKGSFVKAILGKKVGMTRVVDKYGKLVGATVIQAQPNAVTQVKTIEKDGYSAIQLGADSIEKAAKPQQGHAKKANSSVGRWLVEFPASDGQEIPSAGDQVTVDSFQTGDVVNVIATSKGHGFTGTVKRHNFTIGPRSHGSHNMRQPGSIGAQQPQRVLKGKKMAGQMGGVRTTVKHLEVLDVLPQSHLLILKGAVPGIKGVRVIVSISPRHTDTSTETEMDKS